MHWPSALRSKAVMPVQVSIAVLALTCVPASAQSPKLTWEQVLAKHLESIGSAGARSAAQIRVAEGTVQFGGAIMIKVKISGTALLSSNGRNTKTEFRFGLPQYPGEQFVVDGNVNRVATTEPGARSALGNFLFEQSEILREGLFGGSIFTGWPLLDLKGRQAKLKYEGLKKIEGRELYELTYTPKKRGGHGELLIRLYFDPETFRHVRTVYRLIQLTDGGSARDGTDQSTEYLEERFDDFTSVDGLSLPRHWDVRYEKTPVTQPQVLQWDIRIRTVRRDLP